MDIKRADIARILGGQKFTLQTVSFQDLTRSSSTFIYLAPDGRITEEQRRLIEQHTYRGNRLIVSRD